MKLRKLDSDGDYTFGLGAGGFHVDSVEGVAQAIKQRLGLLAGEWFLDQDEGLDMNLILGYSRGAYDQEVKDRIAGTDGVLRIESYSSNLKDRSLTIKANVATIYGLATVSATI